MNREFKQIMLKILARGLNGIAKEAAGLQSCIGTYEPKIPQALKKESK